MIFLKIINKLNFYYENSIFFLINFFYRDLIFAKLFFLINLELRKKNFSNIYYLISVLKKKNYLDKIKYDCLNEKVNNKNIFIFPELLVYYLYLRLNKSFEETFKVKKYLLENKYFHKKKFLYFREFELGKLNKSQFNQQINLLKNKKKDLIYGNFLKDRSVALVGPAKSNQELGNEIDTYDVIIRTNFLKNSNQPFSIYGSKTHVSYYNSYRVNKMPKEIRKNYENLEWIICKSKNDIKKIGLKKINQNLRVTKDPINYFFYEDPMLPHRIIYDVISFRPSNFKIFHFDFYNSKNYNENYKNWDLDKKSISNSLRVHGPLSCFIFMQNLYKMQFFKADKDTEEVLNLDIYEYGKNLDRNYGNQKYESEI